MVAIVVEEKEDVEKFKQHSAADILSSLEGVEEEFEEVSVDIVEESAKDASVRGKPRTNTPLLDLPTLTTHVDPHQATSTRKEGQRIFATPFARRLAAEKNIQLDEVEGSGPGGRILSHNVNEYTKRKSLLCNSSDCTSHQDHYTAADCQKSRSYFRFRSDYSRWQCLYK